MILAPQTASKTARLLVVLLLHFLGLYCLVNRSPSYRQSLLAKSHATQLVFMTNPRPPIPRAESTPTNAPNKAKLASPTMSKARASTSIELSTVTVSEPMKASEVSASPSESKAPVTINRDIRSITQSLERDNRFDQQKIEAAKPPNQIAREYWQKKNHPYKDKWEELAHNIEKAGAPRGLQMETYQAWDGTQVTKLGDKCYKAPDPGRTYLQQAEARRVICPR